MSIWYPYYDKEVFGEPICIERGEGTYLFDDKGNRYIDAISSWWTNIHGHSHPYIAQKVAEQISKLDHVIFSGFTHEPAKKLTERLLKRLPENQSKIFFSDNGSTAVEVALKMALQYYKNRGEERTKIIAFKSAYHGDTFGAMSVSGRSAFTNTFEKLLFDVLYIDDPVLQDELKSYESLNLQIQKFKSQIAAFIFEPLVLGTAGMKMYDCYPLNELMQICKQHGILTIADEVMTGFGRTGKFLACDHLTEYSYEQPDIVCLSKGITGGVMALGVTTCTGKIYSSFTDASSVFFHGHSYTGNPIACTAANANLDLFDQPETFGNIDRISNKHEHFLNLFTAKYPKHIIRSMGTIMAVELNVGEQSYFNSVRKKAYHFFLGKGIIMRPLGNVIYVMPPYCISDADLQFIYESIEEFMQEI